jgi:hypothetical protein
MTLDAGQILEFCQGAYPRSKEEPMAISGCERVLLLYAQINNLVKMKDFAQYVQDLGHRCKGGQTGQFSFASNNCG